MTGPVRNVPLQNANDLERLLTSLDQLNQVFCLFLESDSSDDILDRIEKFSKKLSNFSFVNTGQLRKKLSKKPIELHIAVI